MTITIPTWLLWTLGLGIGIPVVLCVLGLAVIGFMVCTTFGSIIK